MRLIGSFQTSTIQGRSGTTSSSMSVLPTSTGTGVGAMPTFCRLAAVFGRPYDDAHGRRRSPPRTLAAGTRADGSQRHRPRQPPHADHGPRWVHRTDQAENHRTAADHHGADDGAG